MTMFNDGNKTLQDRYDGRAVADKIVELVETPTFNDEFKAFVESVPFFFLATSAGDNTDCSFKGGEPGFVRVTAPDQLIFPTTMAIACISRSATSSRIETSGCSS